MQRPFFSQSPKRVGSGPATPPISFLLAESGPAAVFCRSKAAAVAAFSGGARSGAPAISTGISESARDGGILLKSARIPSREPPETPGKPTPLVHGKEMHLGPSRRP